MALILGKPQAQPVPNLCPICAQPKLSTPWPIKQEQYVSSVQAVYNQNRDRVELLVAKRHDDRTIEATDID